MWTNLIRLLTILFFKRQIHSLKNNLLDLRHDVADYTEDRAQQLKADFVEETERLASSIVGLLVVFSMLIFSGFLGMIWLFSMLWDNPNRSLILGLVTLVPTLIGVIVYFFVYRLWNQKPLFANSLLLISNDWQLFRHQMAQSTENDEMEKTSHSTAMKEEIVP